MLLIILIINGDFHTLKEALKFLALAKSHRSLGVNNFSFINLAFVITIQSEILSLVLKLLRLQN